MDPGDKRVRPGRQHDHIPRDFQGAVASISRPCFRPWSCHCFHPLITTMGLILDPW